MNSEATGLSHEYTCKYHCFLIFPCSFNCLYLPTIEPKSPALQADSLSSEPPRGAPELRDGNFFQVAAFLLWNPVRLVKSFESKGPGTWSWPFQSSYFWKGSLSCYGSHCDHYSVLLLLPLAPALFPCLNVLLHFPLGLEGKHEYIYFQVSWKER